MFQFIYLDRYAVRTRKNGFTKSVLTKGYYLSDSLTTNTVSILVIDDSKADRTANIIECKKIFKNIPGINLYIEESATLENAFQKSSENTFHIILLDKDLGVDSNGERISGINHIQSLKTLQPHAQIFMVTADERYEEIVAAMKLGAYDYFLKSSDPVKINYRSVMLERAFEKSVEELKVTMTKSGRTGLYSEFVSQSPSMKMLDQKIKAIAESSRPVLILGATGLGKGATARRINQFRAKFLEQTSRNFVNINIGAMSDALAQSELFGQDPYSYTGSGSKMKPGLIDVAKGGDIFLDEVGDASPEMQSKLLKVIEEKQFIRVGGRQPIQTNARFIFATNKNIRELVKIGKFREDLYMRMQAFEIEIPALEDRKEDLPQIIEACLKNALTDIKHKKISINDFPEDLMRYLMRDNIPGNIRGIENDVTKLVSFIPLDALGNPVMREWKNILGGNILFRKSRSKMSLDDLLSADTELVGPSFPGYKKAQEIFEKKLIEETIEKTGSMVTAAKQLKIAKSTLSVKMKHLNIKTPKKLKEHESKSI